MGKKRDKKDKKGGKLQLPTGRREPTSDPWELAYLLTGQKKIGKTTFAIQDCEELVIQFDKPQLSYRIREMCPKNWRHFMRILAAIEARVEEGDFPYQRIVVDGAGEWYTMCHLAACAYFGVEHPGDIPYGKCWHKIRDDFTAVVNRLLRLQNDAECGLVFIAHCDWKEVKTRDGRKIEKLVPNLPAKCEEILNGKVDGWFVYDYTGEERILIIRGDETTGAGHRIDGHFRTPKGNDIREIHMGNSAEEGLANFLAAFRNEQTYTTYRALLKQRKRKAGKKAKRK